MLYSSFAEFCDVKTESARFHKVQGNTEDKIDDYPYKPPEPLICSSLNGDKSMKKASPVLSRLCSWKPPPILHNLSGIILGISTKFMNDFVKILFIGWGVWYTGYNYRKKSPCCHGRRVSRCNFTP